MNDSDLDELDRLDAEYRRSLDATNELRMCRDGLVHVLMRTAADERRVTELGRRMRVSRQMVYRIEREWPSRLAAWRKIHPGWTYIRTTREHRPEKD